MIGQLTPNFHADEFTCKDGTKVPAILKAELTELAKNLQVLRDELGRSIQITSGYRSPAYNAKIGGAKFSMHQYGKAADIKVVGLTPTEVAAKIEELIKMGKMKQGGIGVYRTWVHYDIRGLRARWNG
jgi:uncharacterized protein YcbK (DUF882 family)